MKGGRGIRRTTALSKEEAETMETYSAHQCRQSEGDFSDTLAAICRSLARDPNSTLEELLRYLQTEEQSLPLPVERQEFSPATINTTNL